jgi:hypothetical protein
MDVLKFAQPTMQCGKAKKKRHLLPFLARPERFELPTPRFVVSFLALTLDDSSRLCSTRTLVFFLLLRHFYETF